MRQKPRWAVEWYPAGDYETLEEARDSLTSKPFKTEKLAVDYAAMIIREGLDLMGHDIRVYPEIDDGYQCPFEGWVTQWEAQVDECIYINIEDGEVTITR